MHSLPLQFRWRRPFDGGGAAATIEGAAITIDVIFWVWSWAQLARETEGRSGGVYEQNLHAPLDEDREDGVHCLHDCTKGLFSC